MFPLWWIGVKYVPSGSSKWFLMSNRFVINRDLISILLYNCSIFTSHDKFGYSRFNVFILWFINLGAECDEIPLVEEIPNNHSIGKCMVFPSIIPSQSLLIKTVIHLFQIQFTVAMVLGINSIRSGCDFPLWMQYALVIYMISFIVLFGNFYAKEYLEKGKCALKKSKLATNKKLQ